MMGYTSGRSLLSSFGLTAEAEESSSASQKCHQPSSQKNCAVGEKPTEMSSATLNAPQNLVSLGSDRTQRSRERNRVHARKTRERKKNQMKTLQTRAEELKEEQVQLKQQINEKSTASILVGLFANAGEKEVLKQSEDPQIEFLLRRPAEEIPDATKITELPALILPGQHNSKKAKAFETLSKEELPDDGIDYDLLGKDRSKCSSEELDKIRRERNRMHAKRTRDRKRLFMEEMSEICKELEEENSILRSHLQTLDEDSSANSVPAAKSSPNFASKMDGQETAVATAVTPNKACTDQTLSTGVTMDQLKTLIEAAGTFEKKSNQTMQGMMSLSSVASSVATAVSASDSNNTSANASVAEDRDHDQASDRPTKRRRMGSSKKGLSLGGVPQSITAS